MEDMAGKLTAEFTEKYFEKLFYFCLKRTGDSQEAEELTSDITLNIITSLRKGMVPANFQAWVWQIAHNRYSVWADRRRKSRERDSGADIWEMELQDQSVGPEDAWIHLEDLKLLRRELAFTASDYRNIMVSYYIDDRSIREISTVLGLPEGTVKAKLFRARKMLKEGMFMAREFGVMSYRPEKVGFSCSCSRFGENGEPWSYLNRLLCKNILLAAYRTPSTAEELAVEIGVALPYMEDELWQLTEGTLLRKNGKRFETGFYIVSARAQEKIYSHMKGIAPELAEAVEEMLEYEVKCLEENGIRWHEGYQSYGDMKWTLLMEKVDEVEKAAEKACSPKHWAESGRVYTQRPAKGEWDVIGFECYEGEKPSQVGEHGGVKSTEGNEKLAEEGIEFIQYRFGYRRMAENTPDWLEYGEVAALARLARNESDGLPEELLEKLEKLGYARKTESGYRPAFKVSFCEKRKPLTQEQQRRYEELSARAQKLVIRQYEFSQEVILGEVPEFLKEDPVQPHFAVESMVVTGIRGAVLEAAVRSGYLAYEEGKDQRMLGVYMTL